MRKEIKKMLEKKELTVQGAKTEFINDVYSFMMKVLDDKGIYYTGGKNSPYLWLRCPGNMGSWEFFDFLLYAYNLFLCSCHLGYLLSFESFQARDISSLNNIIPHIIEKIKPLLKIFLYNLSNF